MLKRQTRPGSKATRRRAAKSPRKAAKKAAGKVRARTKAKKKAAKQTKPAKKRTTKRASRPASKGNSRMTPKKRALRAKAKSVTYEEPVSWFDPLSLKFFVALLLLPVCFITTQTFISTIASASTERTLWMAPEFLFFLLGGMVWVAYFLGFPGHRPVGLYVWGHETSHAIAAVLFGANVSGFSAKKTGGYIYTDRSNFIISLAPYLFPIFTVILLGLAVVGSLFFDILGYHNNAFFGVAALRPVWLLLALVGFTWAFHLTFTVWMIAQKQPDLIENGEFFSMILIYLSNLLIICIFVFGFSDQAAFLPFLVEWWDNAQRLVQFIGEALGAGWRMGRTLLA